MIRPAAAAAFQGNMKVDAMTRVQTDAAAFAKDFAALQQDGKK